MGVFKNNELSYEKRLEIVSTKITGNLIVKFQQLSAAQRVQLSLCVNSFSRQEL